MAKTITISALVDVVGALAAESLQNSIYLTDNNKLNGSTDEGTEVLKTKVKKGDQLMWTSMSLEPEAYASITGIIIDSEYCEPEQRPYVGSDITFWIGTVKKDLEAVPYKIKIKVGNRQLELTTPNSPSLIGDAGN